MPLKPLDVITIDPDRHYMRRVVLPPIEAGLTAMSFARSGQFSESDVAA
jgi:hypothetical protein